MRQTSLAEGSFTKCRKATCKEKLLDEMEHIVPWRRLPETILPCYPALQGARRRPKGYAFHVMECRDKGMAKNTNQGFALCAPVNWVLAKKRFLRGWQMT